MERTAASKLTILIMDTPIGSGHAMAATALEQEFLNRPDVCVQRLGTFSFIPTLLGKIFLRTYLLSLKISPKIYEKLYKWGNKSGSTFSRDLLNRILAKRAKKTLLGLQPDIVIATHATPAGIVASLKQRGVLSCQLYGVVTDYVVHQWWFYPQVAAYFTAQIDTTDLTARAQVYKTGIPLRRQFIRHNTTDKAALRDKFGIKTQRKLCLLFAGGEAVMPMEEIVSELSGDKYAFAVVTGHNTHLFEKIKKLQLDEVFCFGYVSEIAELAQAADITVTKAGGVSTTELLALSVPYIIYAPLPGQERGNAEYLNKVHGVPIADNKADLYKYLCTEKNFFKETQAFDYGAAAALIADKIIALR